ncbi:MAG: ribokinase [Acidimicrobiales bacterium]
MTVHVACFGSINHDITVWVPHAPAPDETLRAHRLAEFVGGKGANQAVGAARLGARVDMIGRVGTDHHALMILDALAAEHVGTGHVGVTEGPTGTAIPIVTDDGQVSIIIAAGANSAVSPDDATAAADTIAAADTLVLQGEISTVASAAAAAVAHEAGTAVVYNPAPVADDWHLVAAHAAVIIVNSQEALALGFDETTTAPGAGPGGAEVVITLGAHGVRAGGERIPALPAEVVDPTGAGDAFSAALAVALAEGADVVEAARWAAAAGAMATERAGAQSAMPTRSEIDARLAELAR